MSHTLTPGKTRPGLTKHPRWNRKIRLVVLGLGSSLLFSSLTFAVFQDLLLQNRTITDQQTFAATQSLTAAGKDAKQQATNFSVASGAEVTFRAGKQMQLQPGFQVQQGGQFQALIGQVVNIPPTLTLLEPDGKEDTASTSYTISWQDADPDNDAPIALYYDTDNTGQDGTLIIENLSEDAEEDAYEWDTSKVPAGAYYIYGVIKDGESTAVISYSPGPVTIGPQTVTQKIPLKKGWNIIGHYVTPAATDLQSVVQDLIKEGSLVKMIDEQGKTLIYFELLGGWINKIGALKSTEGYALKVNKNTELEVTGTPLELPFTIPLQKGWNILNYPSANPQDALRVVQPLIKEGSLVKVIDQQGKTLIYFELLGGWINQIGNFKSGEGYKIKVQRKTTLTIKKSQQQAKIVRALSTFRNLLSPAKERAPTATHFTPSWTGQPYNRMNLWVTKATLNGEDLAPGDEIGIFDGKQCVGVGRVTARLSQQNYLTITASQDDGSGQGFRKGQEISLKIWDESSQTEIVSAARSVKDRNNRGPLTFNGDADYLVELSANQAVNAENTPPSLTITEPDGTEDTANQTYTISWQATDPDNDAQIALYYDTDNTGQDGTLIIEDLSEDAEEGSYEWATTAVPAGDYYIYGVIKDRVNPAVVSYSPGPVKLEPQAVSQPIPLSKGWNILNYPSAHPQEALGVMQSLIKEGSLVKVIDEQGKTLVYFELLGGWINQIGNFKPGESYKIKVQRKTTLTINKSQQQAKLVRALRTFRNLLSPAEERAPTATHFTPSWTGQPHNRLNLWVPKATLNGEDLAPGDEIGIFDGKQCVGVGRVTAPLSQQNYLIITASQDQGSGQGFRKGQKITLKIWDQSSQTEIVSAARSVTDRNNRGPLTFSGDADYLVELSATRPAQPGAEESAR